MRILVADDDPIVRSVIWRLASQSGHDVVEADDGHSAMRMIEESDPDLLITDLRMPGCDGFELVAAVRNSTTHHGMPIMCVSAANDIEATSRLAKLGITDYLVKPFRPRDLTDRLKLVARRYGNWKSNRRAGVPPSVLLVDPYPAFRSLVATSLSGEAIVLEAARGAEALNVFKEQSSRVGLVLLSDQLETFDAARTADLFKRLAHDERVTLPPVVLIACEELADATTTRFDAVVNRSTMAEDAASALAGWIGREELCRTA
ncbi:MAG TPA: response regulator [Gemmatimonadaceae bacterium]|jgi:DNA-binding response OmpR family regulator